jgi:ABC-2 type transport system ATP-binding protein
MKIIQVEHLTKSYKDVMAVKDISFEIREGEIFGIIGPNGAGKTTTVECIIGLRKPDSGNILVLGLNPITGGRRLKPKIGAQLQEAMLPANIKVWEAVELFSSFYADTRDPHELLKTFDLIDKRNAFFSKLSGGQRQRLFIALAVLHNPEIVFFDELTTGLDPLSRQSIWGIVRDIRAKGKTVILTTHLMEEAQRLCDRVAILNKGEIIALDTPENLIRAFRGAGSNEPTLEDVFLSSIKDVN